MEGESGARYVNALGAGMAEYNDTLAKINEPRRPLRSAGFIIYFKTYSAKTF